MKRVLFLSFFVFGCTHHNVAMKTQPKQTYKGATKYIPSGTEIEFHGSKKFDKKSDFVEFHIEGKKTCHLTAHVDKDPNLQLNDNEMLTVVGYRAETNELVMTDSNYHQLSLACSFTAEKERNPANNPQNWKSINILLDDLQKMAPTLKVKFVPM
jgi:hypothetical protein